MNNTPICRLSDMDTIRDEWEDVHTDSARRSPILTFEHTKLWYECFSKPGSLRIFSASESGRTLGFMPLHIQKRNGLRVLSNLTNDHCCHGDLLSRKGSETKCVSGILEGILKSREWDIFSHRFCCSFSESYPALSSGFLDNPGFYRTIQQVPTYSIKMDKSFDEYFGRDLSPNRRKSLKTKKNKLIKAGEHHFLHFRGEDAVKKWPDFLCIEDSGWKGKQGTSILKTEYQYRRYYDGLVNILSNKDALHLFFLELNEKNIAGVFGYTEGDLFQYFKIAYDEEYHLLSPSNLLFMYLLKELTNEHGVKRFHLFPYDDTGYKARFINESSNFLEITLFNKTVAGQGSFYFERLKRKVTEKPVLAKNIKKLIYLLR